MAIRTESKEWENGYRFDWTAVHVSNILSEDTALTLDEVAHKLLEEEPEILPTTIREDERTFKAYLYRVLETLSRRGLAEDRAVTEPDGTVEIYYADSGEMGVYPLAEIEDGFPMRFNEIERNINNTDNELSNLEERISRLEYQFREENW